MATGDVYMHVDIKDPTIYTKERNIYIEGNRSIPNPENMPHIVFEHIKKPKEVLNILKQAREALIKSQHDNY